MCCSYMLAVRVITNTTTPTSSLEEAAKFMAGKYPTPFAFKEKMDNACKSGSSFKSSLWRYMPLLKSMIELWNTFRKTKRKSWFL